MGILSHEYRGDGLHLVNTTSGRYAVVWDDPFGNIATVKRHSEGKKIHTGSNDQCREWLEANT